MHNLALSSDTTTGSFILLAALGGTVVGGMLTLFVEVLRRRWKKEDSQEHLGFKRQAAITAERKEVYSCLLAKGLEFEFSAGVADLLHPPKVIPAESFSIEGLAGIITEAWPDMSARMSEFENAVSRVNLIAGSEVRDLTAQWNRFLTSTFFRARIGVDLYKQLDRSVPKENPQDRLMAAMRKEFGIQDI